MRLLTLAGLLATSALAACTLVRSPATPRPTAPAPTPAATGPAATPTPAPESPSPPVSVAPSLPPAPAPRQFHLGTAATALVAQAHRQAESGDFGQAAATLERALRIEPDNPLLWVELGRVRLGENIPAQADAMGRKALSLATGDPAAQASAWRLIADSLKARGRNPEAADAERRAAGLAAH